MKWGPQFMNARSLKASLPGNIRGPWLGRRMPAQSGDDRPCRLDSSKAVCWGSQKNIRDWQNGGVNTPDVPLSAAPTPGPLAVDFPLGSFGTLLWGQQYYITGGVLPSPPDSSLFLGGLM